MSSNIRIKRICKRCGSEFEARTTVTKYCGDHCSKRAYKERSKAVKIAQSEKETKDLRNISLNQIKEKEFLTVHDVATLLNSSKQTIYTLISNGRLTAFNLSKRKTLIHRSEIDKLIY